MARRSDHSREELQKLAIAAGQRLLAEEGFTKFSARKVAKAIGYTVGTLYNIFGDYDDIIIHINAATLDAMAAHMLTHVDEKARGKEAFQQFSKAYLAFAQQNINTWNVLFEHSLSPGKELPDWYLAKIITLFQRVETSLTSIFDDHPEQAAKTARVLWASIHGITTLGLSGKLGIVSTDSVEHMIENFIEVYFNGLQNNKV